MNNNYMLRLMDIINNRIDLILKHPNIMGMGYGFKTINNKISNIPTITFLVKEKLSPSEIDPYYRIPKYVNGVITDVLEIGANTLLKGASPITDTRPAYAGLSVSNASNTKTYGTIGACVTDKGTKKNLYILSCSHVLESGIDVPSRSKEIMSPSLKFKGTPPNPGKKDGSYIGELSTATTFKLVSNPKYLTQEMALDMDAAIAYVGPNAIETRNNILSPFFKSNPVTGDETLLIMTQKPRLRDVIWMMSANSLNRKTGTIVLSSVVQVAEVTPSNFLLVKNQFLVEKLPESAPFDFGDSGALAISKEVTNSAIGMCVAGMGNKAIFTPIDPILDKLAVEFWK